MPNPSQSFLELIVQIKSKFTPHHHQISTRRTEPTAFESSYVSFPDYMSIRPQLMDTIAVPSFCNEPHIKPIWVL
ncbi:hypothetical protein INT47_004253 [Mucor saturninus]|uniref:Uncharacterized protein n=1 Tax=Mucor saturninus TaxID=64648 RepID=A0A8H7RBL6_9FUNG|nr:hypothetical protein INT47_004253 [Mucor saturninus]